jgi:hypothetical protein
LGFGKKKIGGVPPSFVSFVFGKPNILASPFFVALGHLLEGHLLFSYHFG